MNDGGNLRDYKKMIEDYKKVYDFFEDEESKVIYRSFVMYRLFKSPEYFWDSIKYILNKHNRDDVVTNISNRKIVLFGAGCAAEEMLEMFEKHNISVAYCVDNNSDKWGRKLHNCDIVSPQVLLEDEEAPFVIITVSCYKVNYQIKEQLLNWKINPDRVFSWFDIVGKMYIETEIAPIKQNDVFVDGGCFDGETAIDFHNVVPGGVKKIYAYEPDPINMEKCRDALRHLDNVIIVNAGVFSRSGEVYFNASAGESSAISEYGKDKISVRTIDVESPDATFIKLDIEGSELEALRGASETIKRNKPRLAISIYHKPEDLLELPLYLKELLPSYKFYLRHYSMAYMECVLFAVVE